MAQRLEDLVIRLTADNAELRRTLGQSQAQIRDFSRQSAQQFSTLTTSFKAFGGALAALGGAALFRSFVDSSLEFADSLQNAGERIGITVEELQRLQAAAEPAGVSTDSLNAALLRFSKALGDAQVGTGNLSKLLGDTSPELLRALTSAEDTGDAFLVMADAIASLEDPTEQARLAQAAFGRGGMELLGVLKQGSDAIEEAGDRAERLGRIIGGDAVKALDDFGDTIADIGKVALAQFAEGLATSVTGADSLTTVLSDEDTIRSIGEMAETIGRLAGAVARLGGAIQEWSPMFGFLPRFFPGFFDPAQVGEITTIGDLTSGQFWNVQGGGSSTAAGRTRQPRTRLNLPPTVLGGGGGGGGKGSKNPAPDISDVRIAFDQIMGRPLVEFEKFTEAMNEEMKDLVKDVDTSVDEALTQTEQRAELFGSFISNVFHDLLEDGKIDFKSLALSFGMALVEMEVRAAASSVFRLFGGVVGSAGGGGGGAGGIIGGILGSVFGFADGGGGGGGSLSKLKSASAGGLNVSVINAGAPLDVSGVERRGDQLRIAVRNSWQRDASRGEFRESLGQRHAPGVG